MTEVQAQQIMTVLVDNYRASIYLGGDTLVGLMAAYRYHLLDLDYATTDAVILGITRTKAKFPSVAEIRQAYFARLLGPVKSGAEAWAEVMRAVGRYGAYREPQFDDPLVARVVGWFGWRALCLSENAVADRARFIEAFERAAGEARTQSQSARTELERPPTVHELPRQGASPISAALASVLEQALKPGGKPDA